ncbi:MAG: hypothetical protein ACT4QG_09730 [Sporichthyaceae bacterium]
MRWFNVGRVSRSSATALLVFCLTSACGGDGASGLTAGEVKARFSLDPLPANTKEFTIATVDITEPGKQVEIVGVRAVGTSNLVYLGAITVWPRDPDSVVAAAAGFPGEGIEKYHQAIGTVVPAAETAFRPRGRTAFGRLWVGAGFRLTSGSVGGVFDVEVVYRVDGDERRQRSGRVYLVCKDPCEGDKYRTLGEWDEVVRKDLGVQQVQPA